MQMCKDHWARLREAIDERGLTGLVARSGKDALESTVRQIKGEDTPADFDPLMNANWAIVGQFIHNIGLGAMFEDLCPLCEVEKTREGLAENWIKGACDEQLEGARQLKLIPRVQ